MPDPFVRDINVTASSAGELVVEVRLRIVNRKGINARLEAVGFSPPAAARDTYTAASE